MKHSITKLCADSLRVYLNDKHNIKLKSGHAHEIVAAFFGYKSKIALLADERFPLHNLEDASFIVLNPPTPVVTRRLADLKDLPPGLPPSHILAEGVYQAILGDKGLLEKLLPDLQDLALFMANDSLNQRTGHLGIIPPMEWITEMQIEVAEAETLATVTFDYPTDAGKHHNYCEVKIKFPRVAGNIGYGKPDIMPTFYSGQMRDPEFRSRSGLS